MGDKRDYYETLGVKRDADASAIKKAYRKLAKKYHPDTNAGNADAEQKFKEITEAYAILSDPEKKKLYDQYGHTAFDGSAPGGEPHGQYYQNAGNGFHEYHFEGGDMNDIFGDIFGDMFHGKADGAHRQGQHFYGQDFQGQGFHSGGFAMKDSNIHADISLSFDEAAFGVDKIITLKDDTGKSQSLQIHIPAGIDTGKSIRLRGKGAPGSGGGENGDLLLRVTVGKKPGFERKGADLYSTVQIPYTTAVFGGEARVKTIHGDVICKIREGIQSGSKIRLKGKGIVSMKNPKVHGDHYVTVQIQVPKNLSAEAKQKLKEFEALLSRQHQGNAA